MWSYDPARQKTYNLETGKVRSTASVPELHSSEARMVADDTEVRSGCCCCCRPEASPPEPPITLWEDGEILPDEVEPYKARLSEVSQLPRVIATEMYLCCKYDLVVRASAVLDIVSCLDWIPAFEKVGEHKMISPLVYALSEDSVKVAHLLIALGRDVVMTTLQPGPYEGATALHLAIINNHKDIVEAIMMQLPPNDRLTLINQQATGEFFHGGNSIGHVMLLALACGYGDIFFQLLSYGGDLDCINAGNGFSAVHAVVEYSRQDPTQAIALLDDVLTSEASFDWYCQKIGLQREKMTAKNVRDLKWMLLKLENLEGYTPLTFAAQMNAHDILIYLLQCEGVYKHTVWRMGPKSLAKYDMAELDPTVCGLIRPKKPNVLEQLLYERSKDHIPALSCEPLYELMQVKWASLMIVYYIWALVHLVLMLFITYISFVRSDVFSEVAGLLNTTSPPLSALHYFPAAGPDLELQDNIQRIADASIPIIVVVCCYLLLELYDISLSVRLFCKGWLYWQQAYHYKATYGVIHRRDEFDVIMLVFCLATLGWFIGEWLDNGDVADRAVAVTLVSGWYFTLFFTRAFPPTSYCTVMVNRIIVSDVLRFGLIILMIIVAFGSAIRALLTLPAISEFATLYGTISTMFYLMLGMAGPDFVGTSENGDAITICTLFFIIITTISLLNMLIAAMSDTYASISENKESLARKLRVKAILILERRTPTFIMRRILASKMEFDAKLGTYLLPVHMTPKK